MGPPRTAAARSGRNHGVRIRFWILNAGLRARTLLRSAESAEALLREVLELLGESAADLAPAKMEGLLRTRGPELADRLEPGEADLMANVATVASLLGLDELDHEIFSFFAAIPSQPALQNAMERIDVRSRHQACRALALVLGYDQELIRRALANDAPLVRYHVVDVSGGAYEFAQFGLLNEDLERALSSSVPGSDDLLNTFFSRSPAPRLDRSDFTHLEPRLETLLSYLAGADASRMPGVNVLLYGIAGTGKTELARVLAKQLGWAAYEVKIINRDGTSSSADERIASYFMAQRFLCSMERRLVIFDEMEDLYGQYGFARAKLGKLFMNRLLEQNNVPTVWIANEIDALDAAARRRFDFSLSFAPLPGIARKRALDRHLEGLEIGDDARAALLRRELLLPAQMDTGRKVASLASGAVGAETALLHAVDSSMRLVGQAIPRVDAPLNFDAALCNADIELASMMDGLRAIGGRGVVALYGPPGAGKSALAGYIADELGRRAVRLAPSDLLSTFLGENEQRVARLFEGVDTSSEAIVLEEADELLAARGDGRHSWEVRLANELLIQMESFGGLLFLTTNAIDRMDEAALRRCHLKIKLSHMRQDQRETMWTRQTGNSANTATVDRLAALKAATPGDFVTVAAKARIVGLSWTADDWIAALEAEVALKPRIARAARFNA